MPRTHFWSSGWRGLAQFDADRGAAGTIRATPAPFRTAT
ncbi:hypothetical protein J2S44_000200 [Catenuloplanes niger]|uniref:Uncharacterized protein n=1 Tax=Catenuloplanes niger TaxID=587534 RepID=A0AAE3ZL97_9ACTN|nr:hypothetical protein [Catenuloplanes niger]